MPLPSMYPILSNGMLQNNIISPSRKSKVHMIQLHPKSAWSNPHYHDGPHTKSHYIKEVAYHPYQNKYPTWNSRNEPWLHSLLHNGPIKEERLTIQVYLIPQIKYYDDERYLIKQGNLHFFF